MLMRQLGVTVPSRVTLTSAIDSGWSTATIARVEGAGWNLMARIFNKAELRLRTHTV